MKGFTKISRYPSDGKALSREVGQSNDGRQCMKFGAEMQNHILAKSYSNIHF